MSLRGRLLLVIVALNLSVVAVVQVAGLVVHRESAMAQRAVYEQLLQTLLADAYSPDRPERLDVHWARKLLGLESFRRVFRDVIVTNNRPASRIALNPMGAVMRDPRSFPRQAVRDGISLAMTEDRPVEVGDGFCVPIRTGGVVAAGAWYVPVELPSTMPLGYSAAPIILATVLIAVLAYFSLGRSVVQPLRGLGRAAARVGAGEHGVRVDRVAGAPELNLLVDAFNGMAVKVAGHTEELQREVERATEETARRERALVVSSRLAAMGTLAAGIAHEINNPIGGMINAVQRLGERPDLDARSRLYLDLVSDGLERVSTTARKVLDFSPRKIEAAPFSISDAIDGAQALIAHRCREQHVDLDVDLEPDLPPVDGDRHEMQQVLLNLFINSLDAFAGAEMAEPPRIVVRGRHDGDWIRLSLDDNGPGADRETLARAVDPFFSKKDRPDASGLGLFISYSIVKNHGGEMTVESTPGGGFGVRLRLPAAPPTPS